MRIRFRVYIINPSINNNIDIRIYNRLPGLQLHQIDSEVSVSPFPPSEAASEQKRMLYKEHSDPARFHIDWFIETWKDFKHTMKLRDFMKMKATFVAHSGKEVKKEFRYVISKDKEYFLLLDKDEFEYIQHAFDDKLSSLHHIYCTRPLDSEFQECCFLNEYTQYYKKLITLVEDKYGKTGIAFHFIELKRKLKLTEESWTHSAN